jgi:hypothetical protein
VEGGTGGEGTAGAQAAGGGGVSSSVCASDSECEGSKTCVGAPGKVCVARCPTTCNSRYAGCASNGTCLPPLALDAECTDTHECALGLRCDTTGEVKRCVPQSTYEGPCTTLEDCIPGLICRPEHICAPDDSWSGQCSPAECPLEEGCTIDGCHAGEYCHHEFVRGEEEYVCRSFPPGTEGAFCHFQWDPDPCRYGLTCHPYQMCTARPKVGQSCTVLGFSIPCERGAFCSSLDLTCHPAPALGEHCVEDDDIQVGTTDYAVVTCPAGSFCDYVGTETCISNIPVGQPCNGQRTCADGGFCNVAGTCAAPAVIGASCEDINGLSGTCVDGYCSSIDHLCKPPIADGESCACAGPCTTGCMAGSFCNSGFCQKRIVPSEGESCVREQEADVSSLSCLDGWCCKIGQSCSFLKKCESVPVGIGHACRRLDESSAPCVEGAYCGNDGYCHAYTADHEGCDGESTCSPGTGCMDGVINGLCAE